MMFDSEILKSFATLLLTVGGLAFLLYLFKRFNQKKNGGDKAEEMKVLSKISLQPKVNLYIVKVGARKLLVGASEKSVTLLGNLNSPEAKTTVKETPDINLPNNMQPTDKPIDDKLSFKSFLLSGFKSRN